ncbi:MAG: hypothetical protein SNJ64_05715 [Endomicrobiia bacterium]
MKDIKFTSDYIKIYCHYVKKIGFLKFLDDDYFNFLCRILMRANREDTNLSQEKNQRIQIDIVTILALLRIIIEIVRFFRFNLGYKLNNFKKKFNFFERMIIQYIIFRNMKFFSNSLCQAIVDAIPENLEIIYYLLCKVEEGNNDYLSI